MEIGEMTTIVSIQVLEGAINTARRDCPTQQADHCLSTDLALMAEIYGLLIFRGEASFDADTLEPSARQVLDHWLDRYSQATQLLRRAA